METVGACSRGLITEDEPGIVQQKRRWSLDGGFFIERFGERVCAILCKVLRGRQGQRRLEPL